jgi:hypothetical protein
LPPNRKSYFFQRLTRAAGFRRPFLFESREPSPTLFARLLSVIDRVLMANAHIAVRNGDLPYFGL